MLDVIPAAPIVDLTPLVDSTNAALDGVHELQGVGTLFVTNLATSSGNTVSITITDNLPNQTYSMNYVAPILANESFTLSCNTKSIVFVNRSGITLDSASLVASYLQSTYGTGIVITGTSALKISTLRSLVGGNFTLATALNSLEKIIGYPTGGISGSISARIGTPMINGAGSDLVTLLGATTGPNATISSMLGDPGNSTIVGNIGGSSASVQGALNAVTTKIVGNTNFATSIYNQIVNLNSSIDNSLASLPNGSTYVTVVAGPTSDGNGGVNMTFSGIGGSKTYNLSNVVNAIANGATMTFVNGGDNLVLYNRRGSSINNVYQAVNYLNSMYPVGSKISTSLTDTTNGILTMIGGSASSAKTRIAAVDAQILSVPTGVLLTDLNTVRSMLVVVPGATMQNDVDTLNYAINGNPPGEITQARLSGISQLIDSGNVINNNGVFADVSSFANAVSLTAKLQEFLNLLNPQNWANNINTQITFDLSGGPPTSLADLLNKVVTTN